ncbi:PREDICTED: uncharacterized protein LOC106810559 isoform X2 [Priapulus caudatus]|uniref:Uncharacterized protein LOC106810559 isoform X2 n=1 Tax=Priapulus caudatus TaxID=37621 RepID=A0ABM1EB60_PRICU|nr:PREDICTED: uncharacterized protein LOC106810559 isoform X2 [Priapulus caudatus]
MSSASTGSGVEDDAVTFYTQAFTDWGVEEVTFTKLMGKRSQASADVRKAVGKSVKQFVSFLMRHTDSFEIRRDHVRRLIKETLTVSIECIDFFRKMCLMRSESCIDLRRLAGRRAQASPELRAYLTDIPTTCQFIKKHSKFFSVDEEDEVSLVSGTKAVVASDLRIQGIPPSTAGADAPSVVCLTELIQKEGGKATLHKLAQLVCNSHSSIQTVVGCNAQSVHSFLLRYNKVFLVDPKWWVSLCCANAGVATASQFTGNSSRDIVGAAGTVSELLPTCGFLSYKGASKVYFNTQSTDKGSSEDLLSAYKIGDRLYFDAIPGGPKATCEWRAVRVSREPLEPAALTAKCANNISGDASIDAILLSLVRKRLYMDGSVTLCKLEELARSDAVRCSGIAGKLISVTDFVRSHSDEFLLEDDLVMPVEEPQRFNVVVKPAAAESSKVTSKAWKPRDVTQPSLTAQKGKVIRLFPQLGFVSFKKGTAFFHKFQFIGMPADADLTKELKIDEVLHLDCTEGKPGTKAKWAATSIWRPGSRERDARSAAGSVYSSSDGDSARCRDSAVTLVNHSGTVTQTRTTSDSTFLSCDAGLVYVHLSLLPTLAVRVGQKVCFDAKLGKPGVAATWVAVRAWLPEDTEEQEDMEEQEDTEKQEDEELTQDWLDEINNELEVDNADQCDGEEEEEVEEGEAEEEEDKEKEEEKEEAEPGFSSCIYTGTTGDVPESLISAASVLRQVPVQSCAGAADGVSDQDVRDIMAARRELDRCLRVLDDAMTTMQTESGAGVSAAAGSGGDCDAGEGEQALSNNYFNKESLHPRANCDTLRRHLPNNEILYFDAKLAPPGSATRWIASRVWRQDDGITPVGDVCVDEFNTREQVDCKVGGRPMSDAELSGSSDTCVLHRSCVSASVKRMVSTASQTVSTGDIHCLKVYLEEHGNVS